MPREDNEAGAAILEFAIVLPLLIALIFGTVEFGYLMSQHLEVRHASREGVRLASIDHGTLDQIAVATCDRLELSSVQGEVTLSRTGPDVGDLATVVVSRPTVSITGLFDGALPADIESRVEMRLEAPAGWSGGTRTCP